MTVPVLAVGDLFTATTENLIANILNSIGTTMLFTPAGTTDTPGAGTATWVTLGTLTVPAWATRTQVTVSCNRVYDIGTTANVAVTLKVGTAAGGVTGRLSSLTSSGSQAFNQTWSDLVSGLSAGTQSVTLSATFTSGSVVRADANSRFTAAFIFLP